MSQRVGYRGRVLILCGPTAAGKSELAISLAQSLGGVVINADSMQIYEELPILTACPTEEQERQAPHLLYRFVSARQPLSVAKWAEQARKAIHQCWQSKRLPIVVAGGGMYLSALRHGLSPIPEISPEVKRNVQLRLIHHGPRAIYHDLVKRTPVGASRLNPNDIVRTSRALEVLLSTGRPLHEWQTETRPLIPDALFFTIALVPPRLDVVDRIHQRFSEMIDQGAIDEIRLLLEQNLPRDLPIRRACGVAELTAYLRGVITLGAAVKSAVTSTRQVVKRQLSWIHNHALPSLVITGSQSRENRLALEKFVSVLAAGPSSFDSSQQNDPHLLRAAQSQFLMSLDEGSRKKMMESSSRVKTGHRVTAEAQKEQLSPRKVQVIPSPSTLKQSPRHLAQKKRQSSPDQTPQPSESRDRLGAHTKSQQSKLNDPKAVMTGASETDHAVPDFESINAMIDQLPSPESGAWDDVDEPMNLSAEDEHQESEPTLERQSRQQSRANSEPIKLEVDHHDHVPTIVSNAAPKRSPPGHRAMASPQVVTKEHRRWGVGDLWNTMRRWF